MPNHNYRVYILDDASQIERRYDLNNLPDDDFALAEACVLAGDRGYEVWDRARLVQRARDAGRKERAEPPTIPFGQPGYRDWR